MHTLNKKQIKAASHRLSGLGVHYFDYGSNDSVPINQNPSKSFNINPDTGRPMQVITALLRSENAAEQMAILNGLDEFKSSFLPKDTTNERAIAFMMPRYAQLPSQISEFTAAVNTEEANRLKKLNDEKIAKEQAAKDAAAKETAAPAAANASAASAAAAAQ